MVLFLEPLVHEDDDEHRRHHKVESLGVEAQEPAEDAAERRAQKPVEFIEQRNEEIEPPAVHTLGDLRRVVDAERLVAHGVDEVRLFPARALVLVEHRNAVKQVARLDHHRRQENLHRRKRREQHARRDKFKAAAEDDDAHDHRIPEAEARRTHIDAVGHAEKQKACENRDGVRKRGLQCRARG